jgi:hypothetical protein
MLRILAIPACIACKPIELSWRALASQGLLVEARDVSARRDQLPRCGHSNSQRARPPHPSRDLAVVVKTGRRNKAQAESGYFFGLSASTAFCQCDRPVVCHSSPLVVSTKNTTGPAAEI